MALFTPEELEELRRADAELDATFVQTREEIQESRRRDRQILRDRKTTKKARNNRAYYEANRERIIEKNKAYYKANREKRLEYRRDYYRRRKNETLALQTAAVSSGCPV